MKAITSEHRSVGSAIRPVLRAARDTFFGGITRARNWARLRRIKKSPYYPVVTENGISKAFASGTLVNLKIPSAFEIKNSTLRAFAHPELQGVMDSVVAEARKAGLSGLNISSITRTVEEQEAIRKRGNKFAAHPENSAHCRGLAFDITLKDLAPGETARLKQALKSLEKEGKISFIDESRGNNCFHISIPVKGKTAR